MLFLEVGLCENVLTILFALRVLCTACSGRHFCLMRSLVVALTGLFGFGIKRNHSVLCHSSRPL